ncbi:MAG: GNAT family N-acetyltransferase [Burkholderiales bacterium]|nr:GNAT family N-acetyltransferase [Bacteroidia bacterium]
MQITLRPWHLDDLYHLVELANNKNIAMFMADVFPHPYTTENGKTFIGFATSSPNSKIFAIVIDGKPVGSIGLHLQTDILRKNAEIGYWLGEAYWGKGIIKNAIEQIVDYGFKNMDIVRVFARIYGTNISSQRVIEKVGFKLEGRFEKTIFKNNKFLDELIYAIRKK